MSYLDSQAWFAIQVVHQHEAKVASILEYKGYEQFYPTYTSRLHSAKRSILFGRPLFPGYVFCRTTEGSTGLLCRTPGVIRLLGFRGKASAIPDEEIDAVQRVVKARLDVCPFAPFLHIGQKVRVRNGSLTGIIGRLICVKNRSRLLISIEITMKAMTVDIDVNDIVPLESYRPNAVD